MTLEAIRKVNTISKRERSLSTSPSRKKARHDSSDVADICALTNIRGEEVQKVYIIPKDAPVDLISEDLESAWGLKPATLELENASNLISLSHDARESFDAGHWGLLPCDAEILLQLFEYAQGVDCDDIGTVTDLYSMFRMTEFTFRMVPLSHFEAVINRRKKVESDDLPVACTFQKLPKITLRVQPHLALVDLVIKYLRLSKEEREAFENWLSKNTRTGYQDFRNRIKRTYEHWVPTREFDHEYAHLPPLDRKLDCLVRPRDSISTFRVFFVCDSDYEPEDFSETDAVLKIRVNSWAEAVAKALDEDERPMAKSYPLSPPNVSHGLVCDAPAQ